MLRGGLGPWEILGDDGARYLFSESSAAATHAHCPNAYHWLIALRGTLLLPCSFPGPSFIQAH